jgi:HPt (histidine-containing phosphotransfer) domain-containing protein
MSQQDEEIVVRVDAELEELIPGYLEHRHNDIQSISETLERGDYETIRILAHGMKGSGSGYGFDAITDIGQAMERAAMDRNTDEIRKGLRELSTYLDHVEVTYE